MYQPEEIKKIEKTINLYLESMPPFGEFTLQDVATNGIEPLLFESFLGYDNNHSKAYNYMYEQGFLIKRHDIKINGIEYVQLTDKGRQLKEIGSIEGYNEHLKIQNDKALEKEILSDRLSQSSLLSNQVNLLIAIGVTVSAVYYIFGLFDFYEKHTLNTQMYEYFLTGLGVGIVGTLLIIYLIKILWQKMCKK